MNIVLEDITKDNWEYVAFLTTNENKMPTLVEQYINGNAYSMLEALYRGFLMKAIVVCEGQKKKGIGFVLCGSSEDGDGNTIYMLRRFMVDIRFQRQGYGKKALSLVMEEMKRYYNCNEIYLSVVPENIKAIHLYEKAGFVSTGIEIGDETHKEIIYKCQV